MGCIGLLFNLLPHITNQYNRETNLLNQYNQMKNKDFTFSYSITTTRYDRNNDKANTLQW